VPEAIKFVRELPKTRNAKILRRAIRAVAGRAGAGGFIEPREPAGALEEIARGGLKRSPRASIIE
jgi:hypothetical protein